MLVAKQAKKRLKFQQKLRGKILLRKYHSKYLVKCIAEMHCAIAEKAYNDSMRVFIMEAAKLHNEIIKGYAASTPHEWERLALSNGIMEYITTIHYLEKYILKNGVVAEIGSGPGRYSLWLAQHGYDVVSVDPIEKSIKSLKARFAARKLKKRPRFTKSKWR